MKNQKRLNNSGFSLVELIVVIAIMAVLMGVLAPTLINNIEKSRESTDLQNLDTIRGAVVTAMASEDVYREVMTAMGTNTHLVYTLGTAKKASVDNLAPVTTGATTSSTAVLLGDGKTDGEATTTKSALKEELESIITSSIEMKSAAAMADDKNTVYVVINAKGGVVALIANSTPDLNYNAVQCRQSEDETGNKRFLISGADGAEKKAE